MESIGGSLRSAREQRNQTIEDVEFKTHVRADVLRDLEADEYSNFANLTYARSFLSLYSDYLGVDTSAFQEEFAQPELGSIEDYPYLQEPTESLRAGGIGGGGAPPSMSKRSGGSTNGDRKQRGRNDERDDDKDRRQRIEQPNVRPHPVALGALMLALLGGAAYLFTKGQEKGQESQSKPTPRTEEAATVSDKDRAKSERLNAVPGSGEPTGATPIENPSEGSASNMRPPAPAGGDVLAPPAPSPAGQPPVGNILAPPASRPTTPEVRPTPEEILGSVSDENRPAETGAVQNPIETDGSILRALPVNGNSIPDPE